VHSLVFWADFLQQNQNQNGGLLGKIGELSAVVLVLVN